MRWRCCRDREEARSCTVPFQNWESLLGNPLYSPAPSSVIPRSWHSSPHLWASPTCSHLPAGGEGNPGGFEIPESQPGASSPELWPSTHGALTALSARGHQRHLNIVHCPQPPQPPCPASEGDTAPGTGDPGCEASRTVIPDGAAAPGTRPRHKDTAVCEKNQNTPRRAAPLAPGRGGWRGTTPSVPLRRGHRHSHTVPQHMRKCSR